MPILGLLGVPMPRRLGGTSTPLFKSRRELFSLGWTSLSQSEAGGSLWRPSGFGAKARSASPCSARPADQSRGGHAGSGCQQVVGIRVHRKSRGTCPKGAGSLASRTLPLPASVLDGLPGSPPRLTQVGKLSQPPTAARPAPLRGTLGLKTRLFGPPPACFPPCRK